MWARWFISVHKIPKKVLFRVPPKSVQPIGRIKRWNCDNNGILSTQIRVWTYINQNMEEFLPISHKATLKCYFYFLNLDDKFYPLLAIEVTTSFEFIPFCSINLQTSQIIHVWREQLNYSYFQIKFLTWGFVI